MKKMPEGEVIDLKENRKGIQLGRHYDEWLSKFLGIEVILVKAPENYLRGLEKGYMI